MDIDLAALSASQVYFCLTQTLVPRPIAWVLSENAAGRFNLAPFSYFTAICSSPPLVLLSIGKKPDGSPKDTRVNIEQRRDFVVHIAHRSLLAALNDSSASLPADVSEVDRLGLQTVPLRGSRLPRLRDCRVAYGCERYRIDEIGDAAQALVIGKVKGVYVDDAIAGHDERGRLKVHADKLAPIGRLGADEYAELGEVIQLRRPR